MRPLVFHGGLAAYAFYAALGIWGAGEGFLQVRTRAGERDPSYVWMIAGSVVGLVLAFRAAGDDVRLPGPAWTAPAVGVALMCAGMLLRYWSVRTLGRFFTVTVDVGADHELVDTGPYARLRHPSYTGMLVVYLGAGVALDSWLSVAAAVVPPAAAVVNRIRMRSGCCGPGSENGTSSMRAGPDASFRGSGEVGEPAGNGTPLA